MLRVEVRVGGSVGQFLLYLGDNSFETSYFGFGLLDLLLQSLELLLAFALLGVAEFALLGRSSLSGSFRFVLRFLLVLAR